jgi:hypothetical protein
MPQGFIPRDSRLCEGDTIYKKHTLKPFTTVFIDHPGIIRIEED